MTIFISGSSRGIGKALAEHFAVSGHNVAINGANDYDALMQTAKELNAIPFFGDLSDYDTANRIIMQVIDTFGGIDVLINNAGISYIGLFGDMKPEEWQRIIDVNQLAMVNCSHIAIPYMLKANSGNIINISSVWGEVGASCEVIYSMTKGAVNSFTRALAKELAPSGIRVNAVSLGVMNTSMNDFLNADERAALAEQIPMGRFGNPKEAAICAEFLINCSYITGEILTIDGGFL
ncbi:MAG: SDR family oxidoreductase [Defluviitaleaceae bacterium]|nr:SDR family oxidoreductase [Defluviitaleaceae bacterium]